MSQARQSTLVEVVRAKLGKLSAKEEQALRGISDEAKLLALVVEVAQAQDARQVCAVLARARAAPPASRGRARVSQSSSRRVA
jgi:hypothetical protein